MNQEKQAVPSPFSALTYQEQQDRWMEWRSRQLEYQPFEEKKSESEPLPPLKLPNMRMAEPTRHGELDKVLLRHQEAFKHAGHFHPAVKK